MRINKELRDVIKKGIEVAKEYGVDVEKLDLTAVIDPTLSAGENYQLVMEHICSLIPDEDDRASFRAKYLGHDYSADEERAREEMEREVEEHLRKMIQSIKPYTSHPCYSTAKEYIRLLTGSDSVHLLIVNGEGGTGKTHLVLGILNELKIPYEYVNGITAFELFDFAQHNNGKVIVLDDVTLTKEMVRLLKAMCDTGARERVVSWFSRAKRSSDVSSKFVFTGKVILILNDVSLDIDEHYTALTTRGYLLNVRIRKQDLLGLIRGMLGETAFEKFRRDFKELERVVPAKFILPLMNLRTAVKYATALKVSDRLAKRVLVDELLQRARELKLAVECSAREFTERTGKSRRTWARYRALYRMLVSELEDDGGDGL